MRKYIVVLVGARDRSGFGKRLKWLSPFGSNDWTNGNRGTGKAALLE